MSHPVHIHPIPIHLRADLFHALTAATGEGWFGDETADALCEAVRNWLAQKAPAADTKPGAGRGFQWKQVFLPDGTLLRATLHGQVACANVEGDTIISNGRPLSRKRPAHPSMNP